MSELTISAERKRTVAERHIGERALWHAGVFRQELGINDPLTHLDQYLKNGEAAIIAIDEDLITDIAERKLKPTFVNLVMFDKVGSDFMSRENNFSMRRMTELTEQKFAKNGANPELYKRAKIESQEVKRLNKWFEVAEIGEVFVVESLGLTEAEKYTIVRSYQKISQNQLVEHVLTLHNATTEIFNQLHDSLGTNIPDSLTPLELLDNMYTYQPKTDNFVEEYVLRYDKILSGHNHGQEYTYGLPKTEKPNTEDDIIAIRRQESLRQVYLNGIRALGKSGGYVTPQINELNRRLKLVPDLVLGSEIPAATARRLLDAALQSIVATLNRAPKKELEILASGDCNAATESAGGYGLSARAEGVRYEGACPSGIGASAVEAAALALGHRANIDPSQCGTCPKCNKQYFVPDEIYKEKILECNNCHSAVHFGGGKVSKEKLDRLRGKESRGFLDLIIESFREFNQRYEAEQQQKKAVQAARLKAEASRRN